MSEKYWLQLSGNWGEGYKHKDTVGDVFCDVSTKTTAILTESGWAYPDKLKNILVSIRNSNSNHSEKLKNIEILLLKGTCQIIDWRYKSTGTKDEHNFDSYKHLTDYGAFWLYIL